MDPYRETHPQPAVGEARTLTESLAAYGLAGARSFQLAGEDLALLPGSALPEAARAYAEALSRLEPDMRPRFEAEQAALLRDAHDLLRRHGRSVHGRIAGYLEMGRRCRFEYPWPVVAVLGISQVLGGFLRARAWGLVGPAATRLGWQGLERIAEVTDDLLRRTNRGIFADSVPTVLLGLRAHALRERGEAALAAALLEGPLPPIIDEEGRAIATGLFRALGIGERRARFAALAELTLQHFDREQSIFTHHLASPRSGTLGTARAPRRGDAAVARLLEMRAVPAPVVVRGLLGRRRLEFRSFALPSGFDIRAHGPRVELFGQAFVRSVTGDPRDYAAAVEWVGRRFAAGVRDVRFEAP